MGYPDRSQRRPGPAIGAQDERVQGLLGERGKDNVGLKALTRADMAALGEVAILSSHVTAAPTMAQHNALVDDVHALAALLNKMGARFTGL